MHTKGACLYVISETPKTIRMGVCGHAEDLCRHPRVSCHVQIELTDSRSSMSRGLPSFEVKTLPTIMKELGHKWVDVLKIDIEGNEWPVLEQMVTDKRPLMFTQMQVHYLPACET